MKNIALLIAVLSVAALGTACHVIEDMRSTNYLSPRYFFDERTGFCFALNGHGLAHVPCTPEALALAQYRPAPPPAAPLPPAPATLPAPYRP